MNRRLKIVITLILMALGTTAYSQEKVQLGWKAIETSSLEAHVSGQVHIANNADLVNMLFTTCFLFTCTKAKRQNYSLTWVNSLS